MTGVWVAADVITAARANEKTIFQGTGSAISTLVTTYAGMLAFCTSSGSGFTADRLYQRDSTNASWSVVGIDQLSYLPLSTTIGDYTAPNAAVATSEYVQPIDFTDAYTTNSGWTQTGTAVTVDSFRADKVGFNMSTDVNDFVVKSLGVTASDTLWFLYITHKPDAASVNGSRYSLVHLTAGTGNAISASQDAIGIYVFQSTSTGGHTYYYISYKDGAGAWTEDVASVYDIGSSVTAKYITLTRDSATAVTMKIYSDSGRTTLLTTKTSTIPSTVGGLTHIQHGNATALSGYGTTGEADDVFFYNNTTAPTILQAATNIYDTNVATTWRSTSEASPAVYVDLSASAREIVGIALHIDKTYTTITAIKIRASTDTSFADAENIMYVDISDFTDDTWRFLANNFLLTNCRYVQVIGVGTGVLAINEIKVRYGVTDLVKLLTHKHRNRSVSAADSFTDSN